MHSRNNSQTIFFTVLDMTSTSAILAIAPPSTHHQLQHKYVQQAPRDKPRSRSNSKTKTKAKPIHKKSFSSHEVRPPTITLTPSAEPSPTTSTHPLLSSNLTKDLPVIPEIDSDITFRNVDLDLRLGMEELFGLWTSVRSDDYALFHQISSRTKTKVKTKANKAKGQVPKALDMDMMVANHKAVEARMRRRAASIV